MSILSAEPMTGLSSGLVQTALRGGALVAGALLFASAAAAHAATPPVDCGALANATLLSQRAGLRR